MILVLCGKSASGKDTIMKELLKKGFNPIITTTTRPMRYGEKQGVDYNFVTNEEFFSKLQTGEFIETRQFHTTVNGKDDIWYYGTSVKNIDNTLNNVIVLDLSGTESLISYFGTQSVYVVYIDVSDEIRTFRAKRRKSFDQTEWDRRMITDTEDFSESRLKKDVNAFVYNDSDNLQYSVECVINYFNDWVKFRRR